MTTVAYISGTEIKASMPDTAWDSSYDNLLDELTLQASELIDAYCRRDPGAFKAVAATRYFDGSGKAVQYIDAIASAPTTVEVSDTGSLINYTTWAVTDYILYPYNALSKGRPYTQLHIDRVNGTKAVWYAFPKSVKITAAFGYSLDPPGPIQKAVLIQAARWFKRGQQAWEDTGVISELGQLTFVKKLDPDVEASLEFYVDPL